MNGIGLDCGTATVKLVMLSQKGELLWFKSSAHHGAAVQTVRLLLGELLQADRNACGYPVMLTGSAGDRLSDACPGLSTLGDIPAIHRGIRLLAPEVKSAIEIGSQSARFLTELDRGTPPRFAVNEHCAGGTGSFFEDQMSRLGLRIEDYSELVAKAHSIPRLSGRCAVFAKTDIIHRQQEGVPTPDILLGLCYAGTSCGETCGFMWRSWLQCRGSSGYPGCFCPHGRRIDFTKKLPLCWRHRGCAGCSGGRHLFHGGTAGLSVRAGSKHGRPAAPSSATGS